MLNIKFRGTPFLFIGDSLDESGPITTEDDFRTGRVSSAHYWPHGTSGIVKRYNDVIGTRQDIEIVGPASVEPLTFDEQIVALDNMLGGDRGWFGKPETH